MISIFCAPPSAPQLYHPPQPQPQPAPRLDSVDQHIIATLCASGRYGMKVWPLLDAVAVSMNPATRAERRKFRKALWTRLKYLLRVSMVHRFGRQTVTPTRLPRMSVRRSRRFTPGSTIADAQSRTQQNSNKSPNCNLLRPKGAPPTIAQAPLKTKSAAALPTTSLTDAQREDIHQAAVALARMPRVAKRPLSGYVGQRRIRRDQPIILPDGRHVFALGTRRGRLIFTTELHGEIGSVEALVRGEWGMVLASQVEVIKNAAAIALGKLKSGVREKASIVKAAACQLNGRRPVRAGRRPRGRPRRSVIRQRQQLDGVPT